MLWYDYLFKSKLNTLIGKVDLLLTLLRNLEKRMDNKFEDLAQRLDAATNAVAKEFTDLKEQIAGGLTKDQATAVVARMEPLISRLEGMGKDAANPVPDVTPPTT